MRPIATCKEAERLGWRMVPLRMNHTVQGRTGETLSRALEVVWLSPAVLDAIPNLFASEAIAR